MVLLKSLQEIKFSRVITSEYYEGQKSFEKLINNRVHQHVKYKRLKYQSKRFFRTSQEIWSKLCRELAKIVIRGIIGSEKLSIILIMTDLFKIRRQPPKSSVKKCYYQRRLQHGCFHVKLAKFLRTLILKNILERLLPQFIDVLSSFIAISGNLMESICNAAPWIQEVNWTYIKLYVQFTSRVQRRLSEVKRQICVLYISVCLFCFLFFCVLVVFWTLSNICKCCFLIFSKQPLLRYNLT